MLRHIRSTIVTHSLTAIVELHFRYGSGHNLEHPWRSWPEEFRGHDLPVTTIRSDLRDPMIKFWGSWYLHRLLCFRSSRVVTKFAWCVCWIRRQKRPATTPRTSRDGPPREVVAWPRSKRTRLDRSDVYEHTRFVDGMDCVRRGWRKAGASPGRETHRWHWRGGETASSHRPASLLYRMLSHLPHDINTSQLHHQRHGSKNAQITIRKLLET